MLGRSNHRRSRRLIVTALLTLVAQAMLVGASPLADIHYHRFGPLQVETAGSGHASRASGLCPECLAMQTMAVLGAPTELVRTSSAPHEAPAVRIDESRPSLRPATGFARAPPTPPGTIL